MRETDDASSDQHAGPDRPTFRPLEQFWPYVELSEQPGEEELAALDPTLAAALYGTPPRPFSLTFSFPAFEGPEHERAVEMARRSLEYRDVGSGAARRHRARFQSDQVLAIRELWAIIGRFDESEVLLDDQPVPYARELWLPLLWLLIR